MDVFFFVLIEYLSIPAVAPSSSEFETAALKTFEVNAEEMLSRQNLKQVSVTLRGEDGLKVNDISMVIASPTDISPLFKSKTMPDCRIPFWETTAYKIHLLCDNLRKGVARFILYIHPPVRFYIALTCGCGTSREPPPDVALEMCVRFKDRQVLRRACMSGSWGDVDKAVPFFPFIRDQPFKVP